MRGRRLDRLFARFRSRGDARALARLFDATAPELYGVATHLARDLHAAEDLVQSTFLAAIEARESWDESREVMPWLIGILARQAAYERRRRSRTIEPERLERQSVPEPAEAAEAQELSAELERSIDGIPALYREVLLAHLKQGKTPQEIARDLGRAPGTVRVQLHRALEMVRKSLPAGLATGGMIAALSPRGLAAVRAAVVRSAAAIPVPTAAVSSTAIALGGWAMSSKAVIAVSGLVVCLLFAGRLALHRLETAPIEEPRAQAVSAAAPSVETEPIEQLAPALSSRTPVETHAPVRSRDRALGERVTARVSGLLQTPDGAPAAGSFVALVRMSTGNPVESVQEKRTDSDGSFVLEGAPGTYILVGLRSDCLPFVRPVTLTAGLPQDFDPAAFTLGERIGGHVRILGLPAPRDCEISARQGMHEHGFPLDGQDLVWTGETLRVASRTARTDDLGRFVIDGLEPGMHTVSLESTPEQRVVRASVEAPAPTSDVGLEVCAARLILHIRTEEHGVDPVDSHIALHEYAYGHSVWGFGGKKDVDILVPCGVHYVVDVDKPGYLSAHFDLEVPSDGQPIERTVELVRRTDGAELQVQLVTPDLGTIQLAGFGLFGTKSYPPGRYRPRHRSSHGQAPDLVRDVRREDSVLQIFHLQDLPPDRYRVEIVAGGSWDRESTFWYADPLDVELGPGASELRRVDVHVGGRIRVRCVDPKGKLLAATCQLSDSRGVAVPFGFFAQDEHGSVWRGEGSLNASAPDGINEIVPSLPPGRYEVRLCLDGYREASQVAIVEPGKFSDVSVVLDEK